MCQKIISDNHPRMIDSKIKHLLNGVIGHLHMYCKQYHIYRDKPQLFGYKKNWIRGTKLLEGNRCSLFSNITSFSYFWNIKTPNFFFSIFQLPIFVKPYRRTYVQCWALITRLKHTIGQYSGIVWVLFYNIKRFSMKISAKSRNLG